MSEVVDGFFGGSKKVEARPAPSPVVRPVSSVPDRSFQPVEARTLAGSLDVRSEPGGAQIGLFGRRRVGGRIVFSGNDDANGFFYMIVVIAGARVDAIESVHLDNQQVIFDGSDYVLTPPWSGSSVNVKLYDGTQVSADALMQSAFPGWSDDYVAQGCAYARIEIRPDNAPAAFENGVPDFTFTVRGFQCYDPRNPGHDIDDPTSWTFSENAAIINANYAIHELGAALPAGLIDWDSVADAAAVADEDIELAAGGTERRYESALYWTTDERHEDVLSRAGAAHGGGLFLIGQKYRMATAVFVAPSASITPDDYEAGGLAWSDTPPLSATVNGVRGTFSSPLHNFEPRDFPSYQDADALAFDGRALWLDLDLTAVTSASQAQRLARIAYNRTRQGFAASVNVQFTHFDTVADDVIELTDDLAGFDGATFRVISEELADDFSISFELEYELAGFYAWTAATDEKPFLAIESVYGEGDTGGAGGSSTTTGSAAGDTGDTVRPGGWLTDANATSGTFRAQVNVYLAPNITPAPEYRVRVTYDYKRRNSLGTVISSYSNVTGEVTGDGSAPIEFANLGDTIAGAFELTDFRIRKVQIRAERNGQNSPYADLFSGNRAVENWPIHNEASAIYFALPSPIAPYIVTFTGGVATFRTEFLAGGAAKTDTLEFWDFQSPTETATANGTLIASVAYSGGGQATLSKSPGQFSYIRARARDVNGTAGSFSNWLLAVF